MGKKNKGTSKTLKKCARLQKARQWILTYDGTPKHMARNYKKRFHVDITTAVSDLQAIGVEFTQEYIDAVKRSEEERIRQKHLKKEQKKMQEREQTNKMPPAQTTVILRKRHKTVPIYQE